MGAGVRKKGHTQTTRESEGDGALPQTDANVAYGKILRLHVKKSSS